MIKMYDGLKVENKRKHEKVKEVDRRMSNPLGFQFSRAKLKLFENNIVRIKKL